MHMEASCQLTQFLKGGALPPYLPPPLPVAPGMFCALPYLHSPVLVKGGLHSRSVNEIGSVISAPILDGLMST